MTIVVTTAISTDYVNWDKVNRDFVASNELARAFLASFILVMDLMIVMQVGLNYNKNKSRFTIYLHFIHVSPCLLFLRSTSLHLLYNCQLFRCSV